MTTFAQSYPPRRNTSRKRGEPDEVANTLPVTVSAGVAKAIVCGKFRRFMSIDSLA